jgi:hypothetical protein
MNSSNKETLKEFNLVYLQQLFAQMITEQQTYNQIRVAVTSRLVEKILNEGTPEQALELLQNINSNGDTTLVKKMDAVLKRIEKLDMGEST